MSNVMWLNLVHFIFSTDYIYSYMDLRVSNEKKKDFLRNSGIDFLVV